MVKSKSSKKSRRPKNTRTKHNYTVRKQSAFSPAPLPYHLMPSLLKKNSKKSMTRGRKSKSKSKSKSKKGPTIVYGRLFAKWCGACKSSASDWAKIKRNNEDKKNYDIEESEVAVKIPKFNRKLRPNPPMAAANAYPTYYKMNRNTNVLEYYNGSYEPNAIHTWLNQ